MKKSIKLAELFLTLLIISPVNIHADCQSDFNAIADKFKVTYKYNEEADDFTITIINGDRNSYTVKFATNELARAAKYAASGDSMIVTLNNYKDTEFYYGFLGFYGNCRNVVLKEETIQLKKYNPYADDPLCSGNEEFVLCQKEYKEPIERETFVSRIETYIETKKEESGNRTPNNNSKSNNNINDNSETSNYNGGTNNDNNTRVKSKVVDDENIIDIVIEFFQDHLLLAIIGIIAIIALIVYGIIKVKNSIKSRRLE